MKIWIKIPIQIEPEELDPKRSKGLIPREFWVSARLPYPPTIGLQLSHVYGVPFISVPPITAVFYNCENKRYSCHVEPFTFRDIDQYNDCVAQMEKSFGVYQTFDV